MFKQQRKRNNNSSKPNNPPHMQGIYEGMPTMKKNMKILKPAHFLANAAN